MDNIDKNDLETIDLNTPVEENGVFEAQPETPDIPPKKSRKGKVITIILIIIALLLIAGGAYWFFLKQNSATITSSQKDENVAATEDTADTTDYAKEIIDKIRVSEASLKTNYPNSSVDNSEPNAPAYQYNGASYYISGKFGYSLTITNSANTTYDEAFNAAGEQAAMAVLDKENLTKKQTNFSYRYSNDNGRVICSLSHVGYPVYVSCANVRDYASVYDVIKPLAVAYLASADASKNSEVLFRQPTIANKSDGYKKASVPMGGVESTGGFAGLFYSKGGNWTYWRGTQSIIPCSDYNSYALQMSFEGDDCYVEGQSKFGTVKVTLQP